MVNNICNFVTYINNLYTAITDCFLYRINITAARFITIMTMKSMIEFITFITIIFQTNFTDRIRENWGWTFTTYFEFLIKITFVTISAISTITITYIIQRFDVRNIPSYFTISSTTMTIWYVGWCCHFLKSRGFLIVSCYFLLCDNFIYINT
jgi:hypothetical protein